MKKLFYGILTVIAIVLIVAAMVPLLFKDKLKQSLDAQIAKSVNATVFYNPDRFGVTIFKSFPNLTLELGDFGVVGKGAFVGDTLASVGSFDFTVDLLSVIKGGEIKVVSFGIDKAKIRALVLPDGKASWDIAIPDTAAAKPAEPEKSAPFKIGIEKWKLSNTQILYADAASDMMAKIINLNHEGKGDFSQDDVNLQTVTTIDKFTFEMDSTTYMEDKRLEADMALAMNIPTSKFEFKENKFKINEFAFGFEGMVQMLEKGILTDVKWKTSETSFRTLFSLVPGVFTEGFNDIKTDGELLFDGFAKGLYSDAGMPSFGLNLKVNNGQVQYPKVPEAITDITMDLSVSNATSQLENTVVDLKGFHLTIGKNPIDMKALVKGLSRFDVIANIKAKLDLSDISKAVPVDGLELSGLFGADVDIKGIYDDSLKQMPAIAATLNMIEGRVKSKDFPMTMEKINMNASVQNASGNYMDTKVEVRNLGMMVDGEPLQMQANFQDFSNLKYDVALKGILDLTKITKIYPLEGMTLAGRIKTDITTKGTMADVSAKKYDKLPTAGTMSVEGFSYLSKDLPQGVKIATADFTFNPQSVSVANMKGMAGKTDFDVTGSISNYLAFMLNDETLSGKLTVASNLLDVNEWMPADAPATASNPTPAPTEPLALPKNIQFSFNAKAEKMLYSTYVMERAKGSVNLDKGVLTLSGFNFDAFGGSVITAGSYDPTDLASPKFDFKFDMKGVTVKEVYKSVEMVRKTVPIAENLEGKMNMNMTLKGGLTQAMGPDYPTLNGLGNLALTDAGVGNVGMVNGVNNLTKLNLPNELKLGGTKIKFEVKDGRIFVQPFDFSIAGNKVNFGGSQGLDGSLDYLIKTVVPAGIAGAALNSAIAQVTGNSANAGSSNIKLNIAMGGAMDKPTYKLVSAGGESVKDQAKTAITQKAQEVKQQITDKAKQEADKLKKDAEDRLKAEQERLRQEAEAKKKEVEDKARAEAERLKKEAEDKAKQELNKLKGKFKF